MEFKKSFTNKRAKRGDDWMKMSEWTNDTNLRSKSILYNWNRSSKGFDGYPTTAVETEMLNKVLSQAKSAIENGNETALISTIKNGQIVANWSSKLHFIGKWYVIVIAFIAALLCEECFYCPEALLIWLIGSIIYVVTHITYGWYYSRRRKNNQLLLGLSSYCAKFLGFSFACLGIMDVVKYEWSDGTSSKETSWPGLWIFLLFIPIAISFCYLSMLVDAITGLFIYIIGQFAETHKSMGSDGKMLANNTAVNVMM